ncbi:MAG: hypothetical protein M3Z35_06525 [Nitrospirota bacterium]|nr:hypothetical protein [Nitrospirota bacterium]
MSVDMNAYQTTILVDVNELLGGPHGFCVLMCLLKLNAYAKRQRWDGQMACIYESDSGYGKEITALQQNIRKSPLAAHQFRAFQAMQMGIHR